MTILSNFSETSLPQGLSMSDVLDPDDPSKPTGLSIIKDMIPIYKLAKTAFLKVYEKFESNHCTKLYMDYSKEEAKMMNKMESGEMTEKDYLNNLLAAVDRDKLLIGVYTSLGLQGRKSYVSARLLKLVEEIKSA